jgi:hypothetical protein
MDGRPVDRRTRAVDKTWVAPAMPTGRAAPAEPAPPCEAAPIPARAAPGRIVPAIPAAAPEKLRPFDGRNLRERSRRREGADAKRSLGGKSDLGDQSCHGERQSELAEHVRVLQTPRSRLWTRGLNLR